MSLLKQLYIITTDALAMNSQLRRMSYTTRGVTLAIDEVIRLTERGKINKIDELLGEIDVAKVHADILDALITITDEVKGLENKAKFDEDAKAVIALVDEKIPKWKLMADGKVISEDVRGDAKKIYEQKIAFFKQKLEEKGNLDEFYMSDPKQASKRREKM